MNSTISHDTGLAGVRTISLDIPRVLFAASMIALGILGVVYGDFAVQWQRIPIAHLPGRTFLAYATAAVEIAAGLGLLFTATAQVASRVLAIFLLLWAVLLKLPAMVLVPQMEATWLGFGEIAVILTGGWVLYAQEHAKAASRLTGERGIRYARLLFALSLPTIGLSHFIYLPQTVELVPSWLPFPAGWAWLTGAANIAVCLSMLSGYQARLAARLEALMLSIITLLVWGPALVIQADRLSFTAFVISAAIALAAWIVAGTYRSSYRSGEA